MTEQLTGLQLQSMGTGSSWLTVFSGLGVIGLASLCAIFIPSAHPSSKVQYVGLRSSLIFCVSCRVAPQPITKAKNGSPSITQTQTPLIRWWSVPGFPRRHSHADLGEPRDTVPWITFTLCASRKPRRCSKRSAMPSTTLAAKWDFRIRRRSDEYLNVMSY